MKDKKQIKFDESVHYTIKNRKKYKAKLWFVFFVMVLILIGCSVMFTFSGYHWNPDDDFHPFVEPKELYQIILIVFASVIAVCAIVGTFVYCWFDISKFYKTQEIYFKSKKFEDNKSKALNGDITKLKPSTIKWYKKMGYLTSDEKKTILEKIETKKQKATKS